MSRYAAVHQHPKGPGDDRPTALQIIEDEKLLERLSDKVIAVTGASAGIGMETIRALHATGAAIFAIVRNPTKGQKVVDEILASDPENKAAIHVIEIDLESLESVRSGADQILRSTDRLNVIINNAGIMSAAKGRTKNGFEAHFGTCHVAHFLLFQLLKPLLLHSASPEFPSRVVSVSSSSHRLGPVRFHDYNFEKEPYDGRAAYGQAKTANIYLANEIERRYGDRNLHATSVHPGGVMTGLQQLLPKALSESYKQNPVYQNHMKSPEQGAATTIYAAVGEEWANKGGKYLTNCVVADAYKGKVNGPAEAVDEGYEEKWAYDQSAAHRLWEDSCKMVGISND